MGECLPTHSPEQRGRVRVCVRQSKTYSTSTRDLRQDSGLSSLTKPVLVHEQPRLFFLLVYNVTTSTAQNKDFFF